jgi:plastocyanin
MRLFTPILAAAACLSPLAASADAPQATLILDQHRFAPDALTVPAGRKVRITLINRDSALEEFDSTDLKVEQVVTPKGRITFSVGPLAPGEYEFMGEFHAATAKGRITARP